MAKLFLNCIIIFSILQAGYCVAEVNWINPLPALPEYNATLTGFVGYYFPAIPSRESDDRLRKCEVFSELSWGKWENVKPSVCESLHVDHNCIGYVLNDEIPFKEDKYNWGRPNPFPYCKFHYESSWLNVLIFTRFNEYSATLIITFLDRFCINLPIDMEVTSVGRAGLHICVELYEMPNCEGEFHELPESTPNLSFMVVNNFVNSYKPCNPESFLTHTTKPVIYNPAPQNGSPGGKESVPNASRSSFNLELVLFGLLSLILLLLVSAFLFGVFYFRRRFFPHVYETPTAPEQQELASFQQSMCQPPTKDIYGPVLQPQRNIDLLA